MAIENVALIGLGAMGAFFAPALHKTLGPEHFCVVAGGARKARLEQQGVTINQENLHFTVVAPEDAKPVDLIIMAVKEMQLDQAIADIAGFVGEQTQILCVMNGIDSEERVSAVYGSEHVLFSYMRISIAMKDGVANFNPQSGGIFFGEANNDPEALTPRVQAVKALFDQANIKYHIDEDMIRGIWFKFMCNVAENMTCALLGIPFGAFQVSDHANAIRRRAMHEVMAVAHKKGIALTEQDIERQEKRLITIPFINKPSTLQDLEQSKTTEVDMFAGRMLALGESLGVETPLCFIYYHGIKVHEEKNLQKFVGPANA